jgi:hypothetical protein
MINGKSINGIDDANIYFVYMRNLSNGFGFVFNPGGERVEGFTSLLWTLIGSVFYLLFKNPEFILLSVNILLVSFSFYYAVSYIHLNDQNRSNYFSKNSILFLVVLGLFPGFIDWTVLSLMETGIWSFLLTITVIKIITFESKKNDFYLYLCYFLLLICRPESMIIVPLFIIINSYKHYILNKSKKSFLVQFSSQFIIYAITLVGLIMWRIYYFGYPVPNTFYAKVSSSVVDNLIAGSKYLFSLFFQKPFIFLIICLSIIKLFKSFFMKKSYPDSDFFSFISLFIIFIISLLIPLYSGGDHFGLHRFIAPFYTILILLSILILKQFEINKFGFTILLLFIFFSNFYNLRDTIFHQNYPISHEWKIANIGRSDSKKLNNFFSKNLPSQGVLISGGTAYEYKGETIDLLGLNNVKMAHADKIKSNKLPKNHASFNPDVFFDIKPDIFWFDGSKFIKSTEPILNLNKIDSLSFASLVYRGIYRDKRFVNEYGFYRIINYKIKNEVLEIFANKKFINSIDNSIYKVINIKYE